MASKLKFRKGETTHVVKTKKGGAKIYKDKKCKTELCFGTDQKAKRVPTGTEVSIEEDVKKGTTVVHVSVVGFADKCFMRTGHLQKTKPGAADAYADVDSDAEILDSPEKVKVGKSRLGNDTTPAAAHASSTSEDERLAAVLVRLGPVLKTLGDQSKLPAAESAELQQLVSAALAANFSHDDRLTAAVLRVTAALAALGSQQKLPAEEVSELTAMAEKVS